jgi:predicted aspartyl protease
MNFVYRCRHQKIGDAVVKEPIIPITLFGKNDLVLNVNAVLDSGSDFTLLPIEIAEILNLEFDTTKKNNAKQYSGAKFSTTNSQVFMKISKGRNQSIKFKVKCMINLQKNAQHEDIILGSSFFEHFRILFDYPNNKFQIKSPK